MQSIKRKRAGDNFTILNNEFLRDESLSLKAKGLLSYILSLPDDWKIYFEEVSQHQTDSEGIVKKAWRELEEQGYARTTRVIDKDTKKVKEWFKEVSDFKNPEWKKPQGGKATSGKTTMWENHIVENDPLLNTNKLNTNKLNTNISTTTTTTTTSEENNFQKVSRLYQENFGVLSPIIADQLKYDLDDYGTDLVIEAMKRSALGQKNYRHAQGILKSWERTGIKTLADADAELVKFENQRQVKRSQKPTKGAPTADDYSASWGTRR